MEGALLDSDWGGSLWGRYIWAETTFEQWSKRASPAYVWGRSFPGRGEMVQKHWEDSLAYSGTSGAGVSKGESGRDEIERKAGPRESKALVFFQVWREATSGFLVEEWPVVVYTVKGSWLFCSKSTVEWQHGNMSQSGAAARNRRERMVAGTRVIMGEVVRSG